MEKVYVLLELGLMKEQDYKSTIRNTKATVLIKVIGVFLTKNVQLVSVGTIC